MNSHGNLMLLICVWRTVNGPHTLANIQAQTLHHLWRVRLLWAEKQEKKRCCQHPAGLLALDACAALRGSPSTWPLIAAFTWGKLLWLCSSPSSVLHLRCCIRIQGSARAKKKKRKLSRWEERWNSSTSRCVCTSVRVSVSFNGARGLVLVSRLPRRAAK